MSEVVKLYSYWRSSCSYRVRIALNLLGIPYETVPVNLLKGEQLESAEFGEVNPARGVPVVEIDGLRISQSIAIIEYLHERSQNTENGPKTTENGSKNADFCLIPAEIGRRALVRELSAMIATDITPIQNLKVLKFHGMADKLRWGSHWIAEGFRALERRLAGTAGKFCVGDSVSLVDLCLIPQVYNAGRFGVDMSEFPIIARINEACLGVEGFVKAAPEMQPDAVAV